MFSIQDTKSFKSAWTIQQNDIIWASLQSHSAHQSDWMKQYQRKPFEDPRWAVLRHCTHETHEPLWMHKTHDRRCVMFNHQILQLCIYLWTLKGRNYSLRPSKDKRWKEKVLAHMKRWQGLKDKTRDMQERIASHLRIELS